MLSEEPPKIMCEVLGCSLFSDSAEDELQAIIDFASLFDDPWRAALNGAISCIPTETRDEEVATLFNGELEENETWWQASKIAPLEDARAAIWIGRKLGYPDNNILRYLLRNYYSYMIRGFDPVNLNTERGHRL